MLSTRALAALGAVFSFTALSAADAGLGERAAFDAYGIVGKGYGGEAKAVNDYVADFVPGTLFREKTNNETSPMIKDRSLELVGRQSCDAGYEYCEALGGCCPTTTLCCSYGYCMDPGRTCCPDSSCDPGWGCCGSGCYPKGGDCCSDGGYCGPGNICVSSSDRIFCCTDPQCTAAVVSGTTSYISAQQTAAPSITAPPSSAHAAATTVLGADIWYWTLTWWYLSFWWTTFDATSEVTYTKIYSTTTFTTTATDEEQAVSEFAALSATLSLPVPASAQTSLAYYLTASSAAATTGFPSNTGFTFNPSAFSSKRSGSVVVVTRTASAGSTTRNTATAATGTAATASAAKGSVGAEVRVEWAALVGALVVVPGVLMAWL